MIGFAFPWALVGLVAAGLPLLLHLVQRHDAPEVVFPAVRYLEDAAREQQRRLRFRHWLLLLVRTLLIVALVLAAAGATLRHGRIGPHLPSALVLIVDNSAPSSVVVDGEPVLAALVRAANAVLDHATGNDRLWLVADDGVPRSGDVADLRRDLALLRPDAARLDLGRAVTAARQLVRSTGRVGGVVLVSTVPASALSAVSGPGSILVLRPTGPAPANRGVVSFAAGSQPWNATGGHVTIAIAADDTTPVPVSLAVNGRPLRDALMVPGAAAAQRVGALPPGWAIISATLPPDDFRLDDDAAIAVRVAPPAAVLWDSTDRFINAAAQVLAADGRIRRGAGVSLGTLAAGPSIVFPPDDPARVAALNRALTTRGSAWHFGDFTSGAEASDSGPLLASRDPVTRRYLLVRSGESGDVLATVDGAPWLVRSGNVLLFGSRPDPAWTGLPLSAAFIPFLDAVLTSAARGEFIASDAVAGERHVIPATVTAVSHAGVTVPIGGTGGWTPREVGAWFLLAGGDTVGALSVHLDPRVSALTHASDATVKALWPGADVASLRDGASDAFAFGARGDLRGILLAAAFLCALLETALTGAFGSRSAAV